MQSSRGLVMKELLIAGTILAAVALAGAQRLHQAGARSRVARSRADIARLAMAIDAYHVDHHDYAYYPDQAFSDTGFMGSNNPNTIVLWRGYTPFSLTTPVAYMESIPIDIFHTGRVPYSLPNISQNPLHLHHFEHSRTPTMSGHWDLTTPEGVKYLVVGVGPDEWSPITTTFFHNNATEYMQSRPGALGMNGYYDPTNGVISYGDIVYHGPGVGFTQTRTWSSVVYSAE